MGLGVLCTVWVWDVAAEASEWGSLSFKAVLHSDDSGPVAYQLLEKTGEKLKIGANEFDTNAHACTVCTELHPRKL